jgi:hypothetical protein
VDAQSRRAGESVVRADEAHEFAKPAVSDEVWYLHFGQVCGFSLYSGDCRSASGYGQAHRARRLPLSDKHSRSPARPVVSNERAIQRA